MRLSQSDKRARMNEIEKLLPGIEEENITLPAGAIDENEKQKLEAEYKKLDESYWETDSKQRETRWNNTKKKLTRSQEEAQARKKIDDEFIPKLKIASLDHVFQIMNQFLILKTILKILND